ncbi:MAG: hypothetical protein HKN18_00225 [Silicimonas sp.]|nr:hypothetical protein [Silicimonas sp.]
MTLIHELEDVLAEEQNLLLTGRYDQLPDLAERKARLAHALAQNAAKLPTKSVAKIAAQASHNEALLASARRGIQAALTEVKQITQGEHQSTYSKEGMRKPLSRPVSITQKL